MRVPGAVIGMFASRGWQAVTATAEELDTEGAVEAAGGAGGAGGAVRSAQ